MGIAGGQEARAAARTAVGKARVRVALTPGSEPGAPRLGRVEVPGVRVPFPGAGLEAPAPPPPPAPLGECGSAACTLPAGVPHLPAPHE